MPAQPPQLSTTTTNHQLPPTTTTVPLKSANHQPNAHTHTKQHCTLVCCDRGPTQINILDLFLKLAITVLGPSVLGKVLREVCRPAMAFAQRNRQELSMLITVCLAFIVWQVGGAQHAHWQCAWAAAWLLPACVCVPACVRLCAPGLLHACMYVCAPWLLPACMHACGCYLHACARVHHGCYPPTCLHMCVCACVHACRPCLAPVTCCLRARPGPS